MSKIRWMGPMALGAFVLLGACGDDATTGTLGPPGNPPGPAASATITITTDGVSPRQVSVMTGGTVRFVNDDSVPHQMSSNPHPTHEQCPELNSPALDPGMSFTATMASHPGGCGFHDHLDPDNDAFRGAVTTVDITP